MLFWAPHLSLYVFSGASCVPLASPHAQAEGSRNFRSASDVSPDLSRSGRLLSTFTSAATRGLTPSGPHCGNHRNFPSCSFSQVLIVVDGTTWAQSTEPEIEEFS